MEIEIGVKRRQERAEETNLHMAGQAAKVMMDQTMPKQGSACPSPFQGFLPTSFFQEITEMRKTFMDG